MAEQLTSETLWQFSLKLYPQVEALCLELQNSYGANINLLLLLCLLEQQQRPIDLAGLNTLLSSIKVLNQQFTLPLRQLRLNSTGSMLPPAIAGDLKKQLLATELELEKLEQQQLVTACNTLKEGDNDPLQLYLTWLNVTTGQQAVWLTELHQALKATFKK